MKLFISITANQQLRHRRVKHFGYEFLYGMNNVDKSNPLPDGIPSVCNALLDHIQKKVMFRPDQMTVNEYKPGQGMIWLISGDVLSYSERKLPHWSL